MFTELVGSTRLWQEHAEAMQSAFALGAGDRPLPESLRVRMGLHTGEAEVRAGDYYG